MLASRDKSLIVYQDLDLLTEALTKAVRAFCQLTMIGT